MIKCKFCGAELPSETRFCSFCGGKTKSTAKPAPGPINISKQKNPINPWVLAWSIINIGLGTFGLATIIPFSASILGVIAVVYLILAQDCQEKKLEKSKIRVAIILNIIASVILVVSFILLIAFLFTWFIPLSVPRNSMDIESFMKMYPYLD